MDLSDTKKKLQALRDRIKAEGKLSSEGEKELQSILDDAILSASEELNELQEKLNDALAVRTSNKSPLSEEQKSKLKIIEKTGTGSREVH
jgi:LPS O-antigen subunit length determinant protein (WzzB/FepE family)